MYLVFSPHGKRVTSKQELQRVLGAAFDLTNFDFNTGKFLPAPGRGRGRPPCSSLAAAQAASSVAHQQPPQPEKPREFTPMMASRELAATFLRRPVTVVKNVPGEVKDGAAGLKRKPCQVRFYKTSNFDLLGC